MSLHDVPIVLLPGARPPERLSPGAVGYDLFACLPVGPIVVGSQQSKFISCGFKLALPPSVAFLICPKSGLARKHQITVGNAPGVGDPDYRGEYGVILQNHSPTWSFTVEHLQPIAQGLFVPVLLPALRVMEELDDTERGERGFGEMTEAAYKQRNDVLKSLADQVQG